jgi:hypothetical protein
MKLRIKKMSYTENMKNSEKNMVFLLVSEELYFQSKQKIIKKNTKLHLRDMLFQRV